MTKEISRNYFQIPDIKIPSSLLLLNEETLSFNSFKIIYDESNIILEDKKSKNKKGEPKKIVLGDFLSYSAKYECNQCKNEINSYDFYVNKSIKNEILCQKCQQKIKDKQNYISFEDYISNCPNHDSKYKSYCLKCKKNICEKCKSEHQKMNHELFPFNKGLIEKDINQKNKYLAKAKNLINIFKNIAKIREAENDIEKSMELNFIINRLSNEVKYAELIFSTFESFIQKNVFCFELIMNFNELNFNEKIQKKMNINEILEDFNNLLGQSFHIVEKSSDTVDLGKIKIIPLCERKSIKSNSDLTEEIRGIIELKGGLILAGSKSNDIAIFDSKEMKLKGTLSFSKIGITQTNHLAKIKDEKLDLVAIASNLNDIIIVSINQKNENDKIIFDYKVECQIKSHSKSIKRIIQLSNGLIASGSSDGYVMFWEKIKKDDDSISLQNNSKIKLDFNVHTLIECQYTNELICNYTTIDLKTFTIKRDLNIYLQDESFHCSMCLFNKKYIAFVFDCDGVEILNLENNEKYYVSAKYDYVDAVFTEDDETFCLCTKNLYNIFQPRYIQQFRLIGNKFKEIGKTFYSGTINCFMKDSEGNFIVGLMDGSLAKYIIEN